MVGKIATNRSDEVEYERRWMSESNGTMRSLRESEFSFFLSLSLEFPASSCTEVVDDKKIAKIIAHLHLPAITPIGAHSSESFDMSNP